MENRAPFRLRELIGRRLAASQNRASQNQGWPRICGGFSAQQCGFLHVTSASTSQSHNMHRQGEDSAYGFFPFDRDNLLQINRMASKSSNVSRIGESILIVSA